MTRHPLVLAGAPLLVAALAAGLAGCGKVGQLERPGPLFGAKTAADAEAAPRQDPNRPVETVDPRDRSTDNDAPRPLADPPAPPR